jgi:hypothetical protein
MPFYNSKERIITLALTGVIQKLCISALKIPAKKIITGDTWSIFHKAFAFAYILRCVMAWFGWFGCLITQYKK